MSAQFRPGSVLDNPVWAALDGPHRGFAETGPAGLAARYAAGVSPSPPSAIPRTRTPGRIWPRWSGPARRSG